MIILLQAIWLGIIFLAISYSLYSDYKDTNRDKEFWDSIKN